MKCLAVCQDELLIRTLHQVLAPTFPVEFLVENRTLGRRLHDNGLPIALADPKRCDAFLKVDLSPSDCVIIQDTHRKGLGRVIEAARDAGGTLIYVLGTRPDPEREAELKDQFPDVTYLTLAELVSPALTVALSRSLTRARVQQYQRYFEDADRVLILLHNDPDPDAMASGLALRTLLRRNKTTAIIGAVQNVTRPENIRMKHLLDLQVETVSSARLRQLRSHRHRRRPAALLRRRPRALRPGRRSPPRAGESQRGLQGHPARLRIDLYRS